MAQTAEELLSSMQDAVPQHTHHLADADPYFVINPGTRQIENASFLPIVLMQFDHNSSVFTFELPRFVDGHDIMLCNKVRVHYNNIDAETKMENADVNELTDLHIDPANPNNVICSWTITRNSTQLAGVLSFLVQYMCLDGDEPVYEFHSDFYANVLINPGRNNTEGIALQYSDVLTQWEQRLFGAGDSVVADLQSASEAQQAEIEAKGAATLATIPEDYTTTHNMADKALRRKADAIVLSESGEDIFLDDSSDSYILSLNVYGKTTQVKTTGKNLFNITSESQIVVNSNGDKRYGVEFATPGTYTFSAKTYNSQAMAYKIVTGDAYGDYTHTSGNIKYTFTLVEGQRVIFYCGSEGRTLTSYVVNAQLEIGTEATTYEPHSGGKVSPAPDNPQEFTSIKNLTAYIHGKNLLNDANISRTGSNHGITCDYEGDGIFHIYGTHTSTTEAALSFANAALNLYTKPDREYTLSVKLLEGNLGESFHPYLSVKSAITGDMNWLAVHIDPSAKPGDIFSAHKKPENTLPDANRIGRFWIYSYNGAGTAYTMDCRIQVWFEEGTESTAFKTHIPAQTISSTRALHGIPVSQNGNYTDSNGQQWVCDEIDFERGKFIQRIEIDDIKLYYQEDLNRYSGTLLKKAGAQYVTGGGIPVFCDKLAFNPSATSGINGIRGAATSPYHVIAYYNGEELRDITVMYPLETPIETDLTEVELQAFRALHTNATNTAIINDQNAGMKVKYVADLEQYIYKNVTIKQQLLDIVLPVANWVESSDKMYHSQVVNANARPNSEIRLHPTVDQQLSLIQDGIVMFLNNDDGVVTAYAVGGIPGSDFTIRATEQVVVYV